MAKIRRLDQDQPRIVIKDFPIQDFDHCRFDDSGKLLLGSDPDSRRAWMWSVETGELLTQFHRRPLNASGFDENDLIHFLIDPLGRFVLSAGGRPGAAGSRMRIWSVADLSRPKIQFDFGHPVAVQRDGTIVIETGREAWLLSSTGHQQPLRRLRPEYGTAFKFVMSHPTNGRIYAADTSGELFEWQLPTWNVETIEQNVNDFERRTATVIDKDGRFRVLAFDEWSRHVRMTEGSRMND